MNQSLLRTAPFGILLAALFCAACYSMDASEPQGGKYDGPTGRLVTYKHSAGRPREMEIYFPPNHDPSKAKVPGLILFHGGSWTGGTLQQFRFACAYFASRGLVTATANYQMLAKSEAEKLPLGETRKRVCITDAKSAIRWFKQHAAELGMDPSRVIAGGGSAGGHISALATLNPGLNDPSDPDGIDTAAVAYLWFNPALAPDDSGDPEVDILRHLKREQAPSITFFGTQDNWLKGWEQAASKLSGLGHSGSEQWFAQGEAHSFFNKEPWRSVTLRAADRFLTRLGLLTGEPTLNIPQTAPPLLTRP